MVSANWSALFRIWIQTSTVSGSGSGLGIRIWIQDDCPQKQTKKRRNFMSNLSSLLLEGFSWRLNVLCWSSKNFLRHETSVADPDPHVFGPPGSGSTSQRYGSGSCSGSGSGSFYHHPKIVRKLKNLDSYYFVTLSEFLSLKNDVNVASKSHKQKKLCWKISFLLASWRSMTKIEGSGSRIRIRIWIRIH